MVFGCYNYGTQVDFELYVCRSMSYIFCSDLDSVCYQLRHQSLCHKETLHSSPRSCRWQKPSAVFLQKQMQYEVKPKLVNPKLPLQLRTELLSQIYIFSFKDVKRKKMLKDLFRSVKVKYFSRTFWRLLLEPKMAAVIICCFCSCFIQQLQVAAISLIENAVLLDKQYKISKISGENLEIPFFWQQRIHNCLKKYD